GASQEPSPPQRAFACSSGPICFSKDAAFSTGQDSDSKATARIGFQLSRIVLFPRGTGKPVPHSWLNWPMVLYRSRMAANATASNARSVVVPARIVSALSQSGRAYRCSASHWGKLPSRWRYSENFSEQYLEWQKSLG